MASLSLNFRTLAQVMMVLSALIFIEMTCEVGLVKLDLESLKMKIFGKNVKKAEAPSISRLQLAPNSPLASELM